MYCLWLWNRPELHSQNGWLCATFTMFEIYIRILDVYRSEILTILLKISSPHSENIENIVPEAENQKSENVSAS